METIIVIKLNGQHCDLHVMQDAAQHHEDFTFDTVDDVAFATVWGITQVRNINSGRALLLADGTPNDGDEPVAPVRGRAQQKRECK